MKQKIVIRVQMTNDKFRIQAMKSAVSKYGVISVAIEGADKDQLVVIGEGVDVVNLTRSIQKKLRCATLLRVEEVEPSVEFGFHPNSAPSDRPTGWLDAIQPSSRTVGGRGVGWNPTPPSVEQPNNLIGTFSPIPAGDYQYPQFHKCYQVVYDQDPHYSCSIL